ncbi:MULTISPECIES: hypothetical protein [unclassified Pseudomonas]|uniref:hypothetical protein n=1 Tax=unclassified Pseudomonas TaxID=196821 RepID=UPI00128D040F|nr:MULTISPECIES: hypothetical protein [unclassified Pseudomonas]MPQ67795.1 hypothetical protein [Pseudomonas sp. MWU12-2323]
MQANKYFRGASNHLSRGEKLFARGKQEAEYYFYSALELRFGIESRYREYLENQKHVTEKKKQGWQIAVLGREVEQAFAGCVQEVNIKLFSDGHPVMLCKYTPITPELRAVGERLGKYLHAPKDDDLRALEQWADFEQLLEKGLSLLRYCCSGNLLGVPLRQRGASKMNVYMNVENDQKAIIKELLSRQAEILMDVSYAEPPKL